jgi:hypothetical protein
MPMGPVLVILLVALILIATAYFKLREAKREADRASTVFRTRLNRKTDV